jgi:hypothetical protein
VPLHRDLRLENEKGIVRDNPYDLEGRVRAVNKIENNKAITKRRQGTSFLGIYEFSCGAVT